MNQVHGNDVATVVAAPTAQRTPRVTAGRAHGRCHGLPDRAAGRPGGRLRAGGAGRRGPAGAPVLGVVHAGRPGVAAGVVPAAVARLRELGADQHQRLGGPVGLRALLRGPGRPARGRCRGRACHLVHHLHRHPGPGPAGRRPEPAGSRGRRASNTPAAAPSRTTACSPTAATATPAASPGWCGRTARAGHGRMAMTEPDGRTQHGQPVTRRGTSRRRAEGPGWPSWGDLAAVRRRIDAAVAAAGRQAPPPRLIVVTKFHPAQDVRRLGVAGRHRRRGEPGPGGRGKGGAASGPWPELALHRPAPKQEGQIRGEVRRVRALRGPGSCASALAKAMAAEQRPHRPAAPGLFHPGQPGRRTRRAAPPRRRAPGEVPALAEQLAGAAD